MSDSTKKEISSITAYIFFILITMIYTTLKYFMAKPGLPDVSGAKGSDKGTTFFAIYVLILVVGQFIINLSLTNSLCGSSQWSTALSITLIPWLIIFGSIFAILKMFPGWLYPFSATIGYFIVSLMGIQKTITRTDQNSISQTDRQTISELYNDPGLLLNIITMENFNKAVQKINKQPGVEIKGGEARAKLFDLIYLKTTISEMIWYLLTGCFVISVSYNYIINSACTLSAAEMQKKTDEYHKAQKQISSDNAKAENQPRVYSSSE